MPAIDDLRPFAFVLAAQDMEATAAYFRDALGFDLSWQDSADWRPPARDTGDHSYAAYLEVDDVDELHREWSARGALVLQAPVDRPYGMREMLVGTPDGHRITVASGRS